jgi:hypothetical protein
MLASLFTLHPHGFSLVVFIQHLAFDSIASAGGYYASRFCKHLRHRIAVAVAFTLLSTIILVTLVG